MGVEMLLWWRPEMVGQSLIAWLMMEGEREDGDGRFVVRTRHMRRGGDRRMALHGEYQRARRVRAIGLVCLTWSKTGKLEDTKIFQWWVTRHREASADLSEVLKGRSNLLRLRLRCDVELRGFNRRKRRECRSQKLRFVFVRSV